MTKEMSQLDYSHFVLDGLVQKFPFFSEFCRMTNDEIIIEYPSSKGLIILWITTRDFEITIGIDDRNGRCGWHIHISQYGPVEPIDELEKAKIIINSIITDNETIAYNSTLGFYITDDREQEIKNKLIGETLEFKKWTEL